MTSFKVPEQYRVQPHGAKSPVGADYGVFLIPSHCGRQLYVIATGGERVVKLDGVEVDAAWEHVSIDARQGKKQRTPTWEEMAKVKRLFWDETACVVQYHPPEESYVNTQANTLHLWRPWGGGLPRPPKVLV